MDDKVQERRLDYDELLSQYKEAMEKVEELKETVSALLHALKNANVERAMNKRESLHYQKLYEQECKRANQLFDIVEKANIVGYEKVDIDEYKKKERI